MNLKTQNMVDQVKDTSNSALFGFTGALVAVIIFFGAGYAYQWDLMSLSAAMRVMLPLGVFAGLVSAILSIMGIYFTQNKNLHGFNRAVIGLFLSIAVVGTFIYFLIRAVSVPPIHDITTNFEDPPAFIALKEQRDQAANETEYPGGEVAEMQRKAFPNIQPIVLNLSESQAFDRALKAAQSMPRWEIVFSSKEEGRIEATATIPWFGFKDDVSIRLQPVPDGTRVDIRSASRIGKSDLGENARRIHNYLQKLKP
jgi:uncharacterized protein (DUF1499 family)